MHHVSYFDTSMSHSMFLPKYTMIIHDIESLGDVTGIPCQLVSIVVNSVPVLFFFC